MSGQSRKAFRGRVIRSSQTARSQPHARPRAVDTGKSSTTCGVRLVNTLAAKKGPISR